MRPARRHAVDLLHFSIQSVECFQHKVTILAPGRPASPAGAIFLWCCSGGLRRPAQSAAPLLVVGTAVTIVAALAEQFVLADATSIAVTIAAIWSLRILHPLLRQPKRIKAYRHYPAFIRLAYLWLLVGTLVGVWAQLSPSLTGLDGASRHALTVGFLATMIFSVGPLILPAFLNGRELWSLRLMAANLWLLTIGCLLRVSTEPIAYSAGDLAWRVLPMSAVLELSAVCLLVLNLVMTIAKPMLAWFNLSGVTSSIPLYYYVTSFPGTEPLLVVDGLRTLAMAEQIPRSLTLAEATAADGADIQQLIKDLRQFFAKRQPRRRA